jgi:hypothetical protein
MNFVRDQINRRVAYIDDPAPNCGAFGGKIARLQNSGA